jgi:hypothetical protein
MVKQAYRIIVLGLAILLAGCGAGGPALGVNVYGLIAPVVGYVWSEPVAAAAPAADGAPDVPAFVERARQIHACNEFGNRLYQVDGRYVYWDVSGACADRPQRRELYGRTPAELLCTTVDTVAGAIARCRDERLRTLFDTILRQRDRADLGLAASGHVVEAISLLPPHGSALAAHEIAVEARSRIREPKTAVVRDQASWQQLWQAHAGENGVARPSIDFGRQIVVAVFGGAGSHCREVGIGRIMVDGTALAVDHFERVLAEAPQCPEGSAPVRMVALERTDADIRFTRLAAPLDPFRTLGQGTHSDVAQPRQVVVRSAAELSALWREVNSQFSPAPPLPAVDFKEQMVLAVLSGRATSGCNETGIRAIYHRGERLVVSYADLVLGTSRKAGDGLRRKAAVCTSPPAAPYHLVAVARHDGPVEFAPQVRMHGGSN